MALLAVAFAAASVATAQTDALDAGYRQMYNLKFEQAHQTFRAFEQQHPDDPMGPVSDAAAYVYAEFDRLHILQSEYFVDDDSFLERKKLAPDPSVRQRVEAALARADRLAGAALARNPRDNNAVFAKVLRLGLHSDYLALIDRKYLAALREMKESRALAERLLASDPNYYDAYLAVGVENYMLSLKPAPVRWILRLAGARTDKEQGLQRLRLTAEKGRYLQPYARLLLAVAALRDKDRATARHILEGLAREFPENNLYTQELARLR